MTKSKVPYGLWCIQWGIAGPGSSKLSCKLSIFACSSPDATSFKLSLFKFTGGSSDRETELLSSRCLSCRKNRDNLKIEISTVHSINLIINSLYSILKVELVILAYLQDDLRSQNLSDCSSINRPITHQ